MHGNNFLRLQKGFLTIPPFYDWVKQLICKQSRMFDSTKNPPNYNEIQLKITKKNGCKLQNTTNVTTINEVELMVLQWLCCCMIV